MRKKQVSDGGVGEQLLDAHKMSREFAESGMLVDEGACAFEQGEMRRCEGGRWKHSKQSRNNSYKHMSDVVLNE